MTFASRDLSSGNHLKKTTYAPPPPLQRLAKANTQFLEYCKWIKKMLIDCQNLDCGTFERCRSIRDQLLHDIQNEWIKLDNLQLHAWQMVSQKDRSVPTQSDPGPTVNDFGSTSMQVIDTFSGLSLRDCSQLLFTIQFLINLIVEDFCATNGQVGASEKHVLFMVINTIPLSIATFTTCFTIGWGRCYAVPGWRT
ncbi:hypothetical protein EDB84DRAFT_1442497 [Lactarius hengduanensis]|nr:hypothetical protein EDB84DRAFT_1442497 [Lactarius hengduanensis]